MNEKLTNHPKLSRIIERIEKNIQDGYYEDASKAMRDAVEYIVNSIVIVSGHEQEISLYDKLNFLRDMNALSQETISNLHTIRQYTNKTGGHLNYMPTLNEITEIRDLLYHEIDEYLNKYIYTKISMPDAFNKSNEPSDKPNRQDYRYNKSNHNRKNPLLLMRYLIVIAGMIFFAIFASRTFKFQERIFDNFESSMKVIDFVFSEVDNAIEEVSDSKTDEISKEEVSDSITDEISKEEVSDSITNELPEKVVEKINNFVPDIFNTVTLQVGDADKPTAAVWCLNGGCKVYSSNEEVIKVTSNGGVIAVGPGEAYVVYVALGDMSQTYHYTVE